MTQVSNRVRKPSAKEAAELCRRIAAEKADGLIIGFKTSVQGCSTDTQVEVARAAIRALATLTGSLAGEARAVGILAGALAEVSPAHQPSGARHHAETVFSNWADFEEDEA